MKTLFAALCLLALAGCAVPDIFNEVEPPQRVVGPVYFTEAGERLPGPMYTHYGPTWLKCGGAEACADVYLDDQGNPVAGEPCVRHLKWIDRNRLGPHEERHCLEGTWQFHDYGTIGLPDYWLK